MHQPSLANFSVPQNLYKFRSLIGDARARTRDIIVNHRLWWSAPADFNDPYDCAPSAIFDGSPLKQKAYVSRVVRDHGGGTRLDRRRAKASALRRRPSEIEKGLEELQQQMRRDIGVCCLGEEADHMLMWAHYADSHRGICLQFKTGFPELHFSLAFPVSYSPDRPVISIVRKQTDRLMEQVLLTKAAFWSYEREWRMIDQKNGPGLKPFPPASLVGVILGSAMNQSDVAEVRSWITHSNPTIRLKQARLDSREYRLHIDDL